MAKVLPEAADTMLTGVAKLELAVSAPKTMIAGHLAVAKAVALQLKALGINIDIHAEVMDLGVGQFHRGRRSTKQQYKGLKLGLARSAKLKKLRFARQAKKLIKTGAVPAAIYGASVG